MLIEDFDRGLALLRRLKALGVRISMDDFGSGYSSLSYLQAFPFDKIKIDRAFVINLGRNPQSAAIVRAVIDLGHGLEMSIVAEGVETQEQLVFLAERGLRRACRAICSASRCRSRNMPALVGRAEYHGACAQDRLGRVLPAAMADYDLAIIGGGLNGVSVARDAAGRGLRVILLEQGDLGGARVLGHAAADPWRSVGAGTPRFLRGCAAALAERDLACHRAASGAADALCDPGPCRGASALAAAGWLVAL